MGKSKKRASSPPEAGESSLLEQARVVAEAVLKDVQKRLPPDLVKQVEKAVDQSQKTVQSGLKTIQDQLKTTAKQADIDRLTKRVDALARQFERAVSGRADRGDTASASRDSSPAALPEPKPAPETPTAEKPAAARASASKPAARAATAKAATAKPARPAAGA